MTTTAPKTTGADAIVERIVKATNRSADVIAKGLGELRVKHEWSVRTMADRLAAEGVEGMSKSSVARYLAWFDSGMEVSFTDWRKATVKAKGEEGSVPNGDTEDADLIEPEGADDDGIPTLGKTLSNALVAGQVVVVRLAGGLKVRIAIVSE